jgi:septal ring factor EnvC (AmiA/AmiB activator)
MGDMGVLNGILYCADCGRRLRIQRNAKNKFQYYVCPTYMLSRTGQRECSIHNTPRHFIEPLILEEIRRVTEFAREREEEFIALVEKSHEHSSEQEFKSAKNELEKAEQRFSELDHIIKKIYEDNATGRLTNERFDKMYSEYEAEQSGLKAAISSLTEKINTEQNARRNIDQFLNMVKKYTDVSELNAEIVRIFIEKIVCHQSNGKLGKNRHQQIDIYYNLIGLIEE